MTYLGIDLGTSGLKLVLLAPDGTVTAEAEAAYDVEHPRLGWSQADPVAWTTALDAALADLATAARAVSSDVAVRAVGLGGQMHAAALVDEAGAAVAPAVLWTDSRATDLLDRWRALPDAVRAPLANPLVPGMTGPVLDWIAAHEPATLDSAAHVLLPKDVVRAWLLADGEHALPVATTDRSDAAGTLLWDVTRDAWAEDVVERLGLPGRLLPGVAPSDAVAGTTARLARWFPASGAAVPVVVGGGDTPVARLAVGSPARHVNLGTGAQVVAALDRPEPVLDPVVHTFADSGSGPGAGWYRLAAVQNAGLALDWALRVLGLGWEDGLALARTAPDRAGGVTFLPFLTQHRDLLAADVIVVADSSNWKVGVPALTTSLRGLVDCEVEVAALGHAVHSGMYGGPVLDAVTLLARLIATLHDDAGNVAVDGLVVADEPQVDYAEADFRADSSVLDGTALAGEGSIAGRLWTKPAIAVIGLDAPSVAHASNTLTPAATAKLSVRLAPGQDPAAAMAALRTHLESHAPFGARVTVREGEQGKPFLAPADSTAMQAARWAFATSWGTDPVDIGVGGSIPFIADLLEVFPDAAILVTGVEDPDSRAHGANESVHLGELEKVVLAEALLLSRLGAAGR